MDPEHHVLCRGQLRLDQIIRWSHAWHFAIPSNLSTLGWNTEWVLGSSCLWPSRILQLISDRMLWVSVDVYHCLTGYDHFSSCTDCDNTISPTGKNATASDCNMPCEGNKNEICGASNRLSLFWDGKLPPPPPVIPQKIGNWTSLGCYR